MKNIVLLTGITGYLGSYIASELVNRGDVVIGLKRSDSDLTRIKRIINKLILYDIDNVDCTYLFSQHQIDIIIHTATCYGRNGESPSEIFDSNLLFPMRLLEVAQSYNIAGFINSDTVSPRTLNNYSRSKKMFVEWAREFSINNKVKFINVIMEHMYGPGDSKSKFVSYILHSLYNNTPEISLTSGKQKRDFIYIADVISAYMVLVDGLHKLDEYYEDVDLGSGQVIKIRDLVERIHQLTRSSTILKFGDIPYRNNEIMHSQSDISLIKGLGWSPTITLDEGIKLMIKEDFK